MNISITFTTNQKPWKIKEALRKKGHRLRKQDTSNLFLPMLKIVWSIEHAKRGYHSLNAKATLPAGSIFMKSPKYTATKLNRASNYSINIKRPGTYYVLVKSAHREGAGKTTMEGRLYLEKVKISDTGEKNVSTNFKVY